MLHCEQDGQNQSVELRSFELETSLCTVFDHILNQLKESLPEVWVARCVTLYDFKSALTQRKHHLLQECLQIVPHSFKKS